MKSNKFLYWSPRLLAILYAVFMSLFALDIFTEGYTFWESVLGLLVHLVPAYLIALALLIAWKWEGIGGIVFIALAFAAQLFFQPSGWLNHSLIIGLPLLIGVLFFMSHERHVKLAK